MMLSKLKWLIVIQLLLNEQALCRVPPPLAHRNRIPGADVSEEVKETAKHDHQSLLGPQTQPGLAVAEKDSLGSAKRLIAVFRAKLQGRIQDHLHIQENVSCEELLSASTVDDSSSSMFPQELLGLSLVPVLVVAGCPQEAETLVLRLYDLLGVEDTEELLMEVEGLMEKGMRKSASTPETSSTKHHMEAVMFNIQQLAAIKEDPSQQEGQCESWTRVNGTTLVGTAVEGGVGDLEEALATCEKLGDLCAGVTHSGLLQPGKYQAVSRRGSRILPSESPEFECWIRQCSTEEKEEEEAPVAAAASRMKRSTHRRCINRREERVYNVVEWIPAVSTLYNLGTAVYYASVNCSATAKERAILSAVDLGTDALMVATGGTAGVAGYALGAGVKTGVKAGVRYLLNSMKQEDDVLVNQYSWEEGVITVQ